jgi:DNA-binding NtrC family response regulator
MLGHNVLVVSDNIAGCAPVLAALRDRHWRSVLLNDADQAALAVAEDTHVELMVLAGSFHFCEPFLQSFAQLRYSRHVPPLLVISTDGSEAFAVAALRAGANDYFSEPLDMDEFATSIGRILPAIPKEEAAEGLTGGEVLVGTTPAMHALRANLRRIAASDCNVLITGETGTGKELVAQLIHQNSPRSRHPLVCINCAAIPDALLESELFGYERGAFTGAHTASQGKLMTANKGTVFFDEIGDMSPCAQAKILRAIEAKEVQRIGSNRRCETDIRILAATHQDVDDLASSQTFRRDLYFRLNVGRIHLPSLRERKADIARLVRHMVADLNHRLGGRIEGASEGALDRLVQYDWPGNVRELKNVIERIFIARESGTIIADDLPFPVQPSRCFPTQVAAEKELSCLRDALATCNGNKSRAAEQLHWSRMTLYRKLAKYGLVDGTGRGLPASDRDTEKPHLPEKLA